MDALRKFLPSVILGFLAIVVIYVSIKKRKGNGDNSERAEILEKAREAKLAKSILKKSENEKESESSEVQE